MEAAIQPRPQDRPFMFLQSFEPLHLALLARGAVRLDGAIPPINRSDPDLVGTRTAAACYLVEAKLASWIDVFEPALAWKHNDGAPVGLVITDLGRAALDAIELEIAEVCPAPSKIGHIIEMLRSPIGISLTEIVSATGWRSRSARAALATLRKRGFAIAKEPQPGGQSPRYRLAADVLQ